MIAGMPIGEASSQHAVREETPVGSLRHGQKRRPEGPITATMTVHVEILKQGAFYVTVGSKAVVVAGDCVRYVFFIACLCRAGHAFPSWICKV